MSSSHRILIVGGGFGGIKAALELSKQRSFEVTLLSDKDYFVYYPALYGTATGHSHLESSVPLKRIFNHISNVKIVLRTATTIDATRKIVRTKSKDEFQYDTCILALGVITTYFNIPGLAENSYNIKSIEDVVRFKKHLHDEVIQTGRLDKHYVIIGAGPTGVELSAALSSYLGRIRRSHNMTDSKVHIELIEAAPRVLPRMSERASALVEKRLKELGVKVKCGKAVESADSDSVIVSGRDIPTTSVVWTSGVVNNPFFKANEYLFKFSPRGRIEVDDYMLAHENIYVIGDNADTPYSGLAQTALHDAIFVARNLTYESKNKPSLHYKAKKPPVVIPVGTNWALLEWGPVTIGGFAASLIRRIADLIGYNDILPLGQALGVWRAQIIVEDDCPICNVKV